MPIDPVRTGTPTLLEQRRSVGKVVMAVLDSRAAVARDFN